MRRTTVILCAVVLLTCLVEAVPKIQQEVHMDDLNDILNGPASDETQVFLEGDLTKQEVLESQQETLKKTQELIGFLTAEKQKQSNFKKNQEEVRKFKLRQQAKFSKQKPVEMAQTASSESEKEQSTSKFFYVDDFFYWLSCKFVTCDKRGTIDKEVHKQQRHQAPANKTPEAHSQTQKQDKF